MKRFIVAIDQGTTSSRSILFSLSGKPVYSSQKEFKQYFPKDGWVEHNPNEIWNTTKQVLKNVINKSRKLKGEIITIDISSPNKKPEHKRIHYIQGDTISKKTITKIQQLIDKLNNNSDTKIMVILDDEHSENHVFQEMEIYGKFVTPGNYLIVEDTSMGGHPVWPELEGGPMESVEKYMKTHSDFEIDSSQEKFLLTFNPKGYLKKINS